MATTDLYKTYKAIKGCGIPLRDTEYYRCYTGQTLVYLHPPWDCGMTLTCGGNEYSDEAVRVCVRCVQKAGIIW